MAKSSEKHKFTLRLIVDEEKNKVVLAEACRDFVDVLFSLLTLPMGTIVRLLENHQKSDPVTLGCFNNLYKSVVDMGSDDFETEACKQMLLYPRSVRDVKCKRLKIKINPTEDIKCFKCPSYCDLYSNFNTSRCHCGNVMNNEIPLENKEQVAGQDDANGVFVSGRYSFILTDDLKVAVKSTELEKVITLNAIVRKHYKKIIFVDCGEDFVELLFSFLATPLESVWEISGNKNISLGCIANFCRSFKHLSVNEGNEVSASKCVLPCFYSFQMQLTGFTTLNTPVYYRYIFPSSNKRQYALTRDSNQLPYYRHEKLVPTISQGMVVDS